MSEVKDDDHEEDAYRPRKSTVGIILHDLHAITHLGHHKSHDESNGEHAEIDAIAPTKGHVSFRGKSHRQVTQPQRKRGLNPDHPIGHQIKHFILPRVGRVLGRAENTCDSMLGEVDTLNQNYEKHAETIDQFRPRQTTHIAMGLLLMFLGQRFAITFAIIEAFRHGGSAEFMKNVHLLIEQSKAVLEAEVADERTDADGDGVPDILQLSKEERAKRRVRVAIHAVDPQVVRNALQSLWTAFVSAAASVKVQAARALSMGLSLASDLNSHSQRHIVPAITEFLKEQGIDTKWVPTVVSLWSHVVAIIFAMMIAPFLSIVATSARGASLFVTGVEEVIERQVAEGRGGRPLGGMEIALFTAFAFMTGVAFQLMTPVDSLPIIVQILLGPAIAVETLMRFLVATVAGGDEAEKFINAAHSY